jgi:hypothetical protein
VGNGFNADPGLIQGLGKKLRSGSDSLNNLAGGVPGVPDAGDMSGIMGAVIAKQVQAAGELATGVGAAASVLADNARSYDESDQQAKRALPHLK